MLGIALKIALSSAFGSMGAQMIERVTGPLGKNEVRRHDAAHEAALPTDPVVPTRQMRRSAERRLAKKVLRGKK